MIYFAIIFLETIYRIVIRISRMRRTPPEGIFGMIFSNA